MNAHSKSARTLGADIRALRKARGLTIEDMANRLGRSLGWISQVERDISAPTVEDLQEFSRIFNVPLSLFFGHAEAPAQEQGYVVRASGRRAIGSEEGLTESLLSPDLTDDFEVIHSVFAPGAERKTPVQRDTQEIGTLVEGALTLWIGERRFELSNGDSFRIRGEPYRWHNPHPRPAVAVWVISPPVY